MSQRRVAHLRLVSSNLSSRSRRKTLSSVTCRMLRAPSCDGSPLAKKALCLETHSPRAAAVVEQLVDDLLDELG